MDNQLSDVGQNSLFELDAVEVNHTEVILVVNVLKDLPDQVPKREELFPHEPVVDVD